jgi:hypothetical protein
VNSLLTVIGGLLSVVLSLLLGFRGAVLVALAVMRRKAVRRIVVEDGMAGGSGRCVGPVPDTW